MQETLLLSYEKPVSSNIKTKYVAKIRFIIYAILETQIDIVFATSIISCFTKNLGPDYFIAVNQVLRYLAGSLEKSITFEGKSKLNLIRITRF